MMLTAARSSVLHRKLICRYLSISAIPRINGILASNPTTPRQQEMLKMDLKSIFSKAVKSVQPRDMVYHALNIDNNNTLRVEDQEYELKQNVYIVGFGKAVIGMMRAAEDILQHHVVRGIASIPVGLQESLKKAEMNDFLLRKNTKIEVYEGAKNNFPDENSHHAAMQIHRLAQSLTDQDILLVLTSGGGSALLPAPVPSISLDEKAIVTKVIAAAGCNIHELNTVRKNLSLLKGGGLAKVAAPAKVICLMLSDIVGDPLDLIASGPTVADKSTARQCLDLFRQHDVQSKIPDSVVKYLRRKATDEEQEQRRLGQPESVVLSSDFRKLIGDPNVDKVYDTHVQNLVVGCNKVAVKSAFRQATELGYHPLIISQTLEGEAKEIGAMFAHLAKYICLSHGNKMQNQSNQELIKAEMDLIHHGVTKECINKVSGRISEAISHGKPLCIIAGGETTVRLDNVTCTGHGGRNQELALSAAIEMHKMFSQIKILENYAVELLSAGTDGQDGPTDAAGAYANPHQWQAAESVSVAAESYLADHDSYTFFKQLNNGVDQLVIGQTGTNVMDLQILLIKPINL